jgi:hypothetical protein
VLPYDLDLHLRAVHREPHLLEVAIGGSIEGHARWRLEEQHGPDAAPLTRLDFEQEVRARAPMLVLGSWLARPLLAWNHARMMRGAEEGLARRFSLKPASRPA